MDASIIDFLVAALRIATPLLFAAFGGGFTWGGLYLTWAYNPPGK